MVKKLKHFFVYDKQAWYLLIVLIRLKNIFNNNNKLNTNFYLYNYYASLKNKYETFKTYFVFKKKLSNSFTEK